MFLGHYSFAALWEQEFMAILVKAKHAPAKKINQMRTLLIAVLCSISLAQEHHDEASALGYSTLPRGAVTVMGDDGLPEHYSLLYPELIANGIPCTEAIVVGFLNKTGFISSGQMKEMHAGGCDIENHSWTHSDMTKLTISQMQHEYYDSLISLQGYGMTPKHFILPRGAYNTTVIGQLQACKINGIPCYKSVRSTDPGVNRLGQYTWNVRLYEVNLETTPAQIDTWISQAEQTNGWLILLLHRIRQDCQGYEWCTSPGMLSTVISKAKNSGLDLLSYADAWEEFK